MGIAACLGATETLTPWQQWPGDGGVGMGYLNAGGGFEVCLFTPPPLAILTLRSEEQGPAPP